MYLIRLKFTIMSVTMQNVHIAVYMVSRVYATYKVVAGMTGLQSQTWAETSLYSLLTLELIQDVFAISDNAVALWNAEYKDRFTELFKKSS